MEKEKRIMKRENKLINIIIVPTIIKGTFGEVVAVLLCWEGVEVSNLTTYKISSEF